MLSDALSNEATREATAQWLSNVKALDMAFRAPGTQAATIKWLTEVKILSDTLPEQ